MYDNTCLESRLATLDFLNNHDFEILRQLLSTRLSVTPGDTIIHENESISHTHVVLEGWGFRYRSLDDGSRQILNFLIPGDIAGFFAIVLSTSDCGFQAITPMQLSHYPAAGLMDTVGASPRLILALSWVAAMSEIVLDEHITRLGRKNARSRMAHLLLELHVRLRQSGVEDIDTLRFPITQALLADALGMSIVHANRSFKSLAADSLALREGKSITLLDTSGLAKIAHFDDKYLAQDAVPQATRAAVERRSHH